jgi:dynactin-4
LEAPLAGSLLGSEQAAQSGPWVLSCAHCNWSSKEIGIKFEKPNGIYSQLSRIRNGGITVVPFKERRDREDGRRNIATSIIVEEEEDDSKAQADDDLDIETRFSKLRSFYQSQLAETSAASSLNFSGEYGFGSPGALSRIMGLYTGGSYSDKKSKSKTGLMREAYDVSEGLHICPSSDPTLEQLQNEGWGGTASQEQRSNQSNNPRFISELRPVPYLLRTKRSKRCRACRHILSKPEAKVLTTRFRIRLVALSYIPSMTITPLSSLPQPAGNPALLLTPLKPTQFLLTLKNPLFDPVKITLATPSHTPGRFSSKITILCPQFEVGANTDVWDEALQDGSEREKRRTTREVGEGQGQAEAGKVWEKGRNWVSVVVEVVPASLQVERGLAVLRKGFDGVDGVIEERELAEDEDILEIPVFVRVEWETDTANDDAGGAASKDKDVKEKRELAYWCVLGVGRIAQT